MSLKLSDASKSAGVIAPAGNHPARCYSIIDTGSHTENGQYGVKTNRKIRVAWELPDEQHVFKQGGDPEPFMVNKTYNFVMGEKATFRQDLESWRGRPFTEDEMNTFELKALLGAPCMVNVVHVKKPNGTYANVQSITPLPKALKATLKPAINAPIYYEVSMGRNAVFQALPEFIREIIAKCNEWNEEEPKTATAGVATEEEVDDLPF